MDKCTKEDHSGRPAIGAAPERSSVRMARRRPILASGALLAALLGLTALPWKGIAHAQPGANAPRSGTDSVVPDKSGQAAAPGCPALLDHRMPRLQDEATQDLCRHAGQVVLVVNTASYCGFTRQYEGLEKLHARYAERGLVVLGFPSNDFGGQEPGSNAQIAEFCANTFGVKFPMFAKSSVTGASANPLFAALAKESGRAPRWNFHKYLIGRDGRLVADWSSLTSPDDRKLVAEIERQLAAARPKAGSAPRS